MSTLQKTAELQAKILNLAEAQLLSGGYSALNLGQIAGNLKISPSKVQAYFATKADVALVLVQRARRRFKKWKKLPDQVNSTPYFKLLNFVQLYDNYQLQDQRLNYLAAASISLSQLPAGTRSEFEKLADDQRKFITEVLKEGKARGGLKYRGKAKAKAGSFLASLTGALLLARLQGTEGYELVTGQLLAELKA